MARPREFDIDEAVGRAMAVFWRLGYDGASLSDLLDGMGIARGSLYKAFTDKKSLFLLALERYDREAVTPGVALLTDPAVTDGWARIVQLFETVVGFARDGDRRGCMLCSAAAGPAASDPEIAAEVHRMLERMRNGFLAALGDSPRHGALAPSALQDRAETLTTLYVGLRILARAQAPLARLDGCLTALQALESDGAR